MKTKILFSLLTFLLFVNLSVFSQIIDDNFDTETVGALPNGWVIKFNGSGDANQKVVNTNSVSPDNSFELEGAGSWSASLTKTPSIMPANLSIEAYVKVEKILSGPVGNFALYNPNAGTWGTSCYRVEFNNGKIIANYTGGNAYEIQDYNIDQWYHIKIKANLTTKLYQVYIDGVQVTGTYNSNTISDFPAHPTTTPTVILLTAGNAGTTKMWFDDIKLYKTNTELVAYYPFNGNANDESGYENHGTVNGATLTTDRFGNTDSAYSFDSNDNITIDHNDILNISGELTLSVWVKPNTLQNAMILGKSNYSSATNYLLRTKSTGYIQFEYKVFANSNSTPLVAGTWNHIAAVSQDDNSKQIYINGVLASHTTDSSPYGIVPNNLTIGYASYGSEYFNGSIDDLRIYKSALSETDILSLYTNNSLKVENITSTTASTFYVSKNILHFKNTHNLNNVKSVEVYNLLGQQVFKTSKIEEEISFSQLKNGIYIVKVNTTNSYQTLKIIIN